MHYTTQMTVTLLFKIRPHLGWCGNVQIPQRTCGRAAHCGPVHDGGTLFSSISNIYRNASISKKCNFLWISLVTPVSVSHGWLLVRASRLRTSCGGICFNGLVTHAHVGVVTSSWHSSHYHLPARPQVMWPTCAGLKAAAALTGEREDQPTAPPCAITRRAGRISRVRRRGGFAFRGGRSKPPRDPVCCSAGSTDALMPLHWKRNGLSWRTSD